MNIRIIATNETGYAHEITNLYWFEEYGINDWYGDGVDGRWFFKIWVNDRLVFDSVNLPDRPSAL